MIAKDIASTLKTKNHLNFYENFYEINTKVLAEALNEILTDNSELKVIEASELYRQNMLDMAQFIYSKYLAERKAETPQRSRTAKKTELLSDASLQTLYSFAV